MILDSLFASWPGLAPALGNHLWQSTLFAAAAGLLTVTLRKNRARARYWLWLVASVKFLSPFSLLVAFGSHLGPPNVRPTAQAVVFLVMQEFNQPFSTWNPSHATAPFAWSPFVAALRFLPVLLLVIWLCGSAALLSLWWLRWRRLTAATRGVPAADRGREFDVLHRVQQNERFGGHVELIISATGLEPGILGIRRPILVLPAGISNRLTDAQLEATITHELCHVRHRDNLAAGVHMLVEALFWFHPLVWWIGGRLVNERECACDEEVLIAGSNPQVYAESILRVCEFYLESPLFCAAGVTGSNLKKRIEAIMTNRVGRKLEAGKKLLLAAAGIAAVAGPLALGLLDATQGRAQSQAPDLPAITHTFESASIKPNTSDTPMPGFSIQGKSFSAVLFKPDRFMATNVTLQGLIRVAYGVQDSQIVGGPDWLNSEKYDMEATIGSSLVDQLSKVSTEEAGLERGRILQSFLANRFKLMLHRETREVNGYALVIAKGGPKFQQANPGDTYPNGVRDPQGRHIGAGNLETGPCKVVGQGVPVAALAFDLSQKTGSIVVDKTNLQGNYDFTLDCHTAFMERGESLLTVLPGQLGLELHAQTVPVEMLVIDHAEKPDESQAQETLPPVPAFESAMIRPNNGEPMAGFTIVGKPFKAIMWKGDRLMATNFTLHGLIRVAYGVTDDQIVGGPDWRNTEGYDLDAKMGKSVLDEMQKNARRYGVSGRTLMFQKLLSDRFKLSFHRETKDLPVYALVVAANGPRLQPAKPGDTYTNGLKKPDGSPMGANILLAPESGKLVGQGIPIASLVKDLSAEYYLHRTVLDKTGLTDKYDFTLQWTPEESQAAILAALQEQLGLKLEPQRAPVEVLVIDHAEKPSEN